MAVRYYSPRDVAFCRTSGPEYVNACSSTHHPRVAGAKVAYNRFALHTGSSTDSTDTPFRIGSIRDILPQAGLRLVTGSPATARQDAWLCQRQHDRVTRPRTQPYTGLRYSQLGPLWRTSGRTSAVTALTRCTTLSAQPFVPEDPAPSLFLGTVEIFMSADCLFYYH